MERGTTEFGKNFRQHRESLGWTQQDMAQKLGKSRSLISMWESYQVPTIKTIKQISQILGINAMKWLEVPVEAEDQSPMLVLSIQNLSVSQAQTMIDLIKEKGISNVIAS